MAAAEDFAAVLDSLIVCKFLRKCFADFYSETADMLNHVTGWDYTAAEVRGAGERIHTLKKVFNIREHWQPEDDWLPERLLKEVVRDGVGAGGRVSPAELRDMLRGYYLARGWDERGYIPEEKRQQLGV